MMRPRVGASSLRSSLSLSLLVLVAWSSWSARSVLGQELCCDRNPGMCSGNCVNDYDSTGYNYDCHCTMSGGAIAGVVLACVFVAVLCLVLCRRRYQRRHLWLAQGGAAAQPILYQPQGPISSYPGSGGYGGAPGNVVFAPQPAYAPGTFAGQAYTTGGGPFQPHQVQPSAPAFYGQPGAPTPSQQYQAYRPQQEGTYAVMPAPAAGAS